MPGLLAANLSCSDSAFRMASIAGRATQSIPALALLAKDLEKQRDGFLLAIEGMRFRLTRRTDTAPLPQQADLTKEIGLDRHGIVARHVPGSVSPLDIKLIRLNDHGTRIAKAALRVQRHL